MSYKIDLHMHSTASDGTDTPEQLAEKMKTEGIQVFALTDHDTVDGVKALAGKAPNSVMFIPGIEFSCRMDSGKCHILGYDCDTDHPAFREALEEGVTLRKAKLEKRIAFLYEQGIRFPEDELEKLRQMPSVGKPHLAKLMMKYGYAADIQTAIVETINRCPSHNSRIAAKIAVTAILASGGIPVWAHPLGGEGEKEIAPKQFDNMLNELTEYGLMGMECFYSKYSLIKCQELASVAREHNLLISGGSDYHGTNKSIAPGTLNKDEQDVLPEQITILNRLTERRNIRL